MSIVVGTASYSNGEQQFFTDPKEFIKTVHEADILLHKAAKRAFDELGLKKLPTIKSLRAEYAELLAAKKTAYPEYQTTRKEMKELTMAKANIDRILEKTDRVDEKKPEHGRQ